MADCQDLLCRTLSRVGVVKGKKRFSDVVVIPGVFSKPEEELTECFLSFHLADTIQFAHETVRMLQKDKTKKCFGAPVMLDGGLKQLFRDRRQRSPVVFLDDLFEQMKEEKQYSLTIHIVGHADTKTNLYVGTGKTSPLELAEMMQNELAKEKDFFQQKSINFLFHICDSALGETAEDILASSMIGIFSVWLRDLGYRVNVSGFPGLYFSLSGSCGATVRLGGKDIDWKKVVISISETGTISVPNIPKKLNLKMG